jgi:Glycosyl hydrolases family 35
MAPSQRSWFDDRGLVVASHGDAAPRRLGLWLGSMHYWRTPVQSWRSCLRALKQLGLTVVESHVPWRVHEPAPGRWQWQGPNDLARFVAEAGDAGLAVLLRVGPHAGAQLAGLGFPDDVLGDTRMLARTAHDAVAWLPTPPRASPVPSYASAALHARVGHWYRALGEQLAPLAAPAGPLVALGIDDQAQQFLRRGAFDLDYHPDALARWAELHPRWPEPPRRWDDRDAERCLAWVHFKDDALADALRRFHHALDDAGFTGIARCHNMALDARAAAAREAAIDGVVAVDSHGPVHAASLRRAALRALGPRPLPVVLECGVGAAPWMPPTGGSRADRDRAVTLLASGARGLGFSMAVERERWSGGLLDARGQLDADSGWAESLLRALQQVGWSALQRPASIAVVRSRADEVLGEASGALDPLTPALSELLPLGPAGHAELAAPDVGDSARWLAAVEQALERAGLQYRVLDAAASVEQLAGFRVVIAPLGDRVERALWLALCDLAEQRRAVVVLGPQPPRRDEYGAELPRAAPRRVGKMRSGSLLDLEGLAADLRQLAPPPAGWRCEGVGVVLSLACDGDGQARVLFAFLDEVGGQAGGPQQPEPGAPRARSGMTSPASADGDNRRGVELRCEAGVTALSDVFSGQRIAVRDGAARLPLARSPSMWIIERDQRTR